MGFCSEGITHTVLTASRTIPATPVEDHPEVTQLLGRLGYGSFVGPVRYRGRNENWAGRTKDGSSLFVKLFADSGGADTAAQLRRTRLFSEIWDADGDGCETFAAPRLLHIDERRRIAIFEHVEGAISAAELVADDDFTVEDSGKIGRLLGEAHNLDVSQVADSAPFSFPARLAADSLPIRDFLNASGAELDVFALIQNDQALRESLARLCASESESAQGFCHGDFRLDQLLKVKGSWWLTDWEECRRGCQARDVGGYIGEWFYRAVAKIGQREAARDPARQATPSSHAEVMGRGRAGLAWAQPFVTSFWDSYSKVQGSCGDDFIIQVTAFAGWHLFDRILAMAQRRNQLSAYDRAVLGAGKRVLDRPEQFWSVLGLQRS
jgi:5-methylthioribose kinase